jgi:transposase-like protein
MTKRTRRNHNPAFKAKVALEALREQETVAEIARRYRLHTNVVTNWKRQLAENVEGCSRRAAPRAEREASCSRRSGS